MEVFLFSVISAFLLFAVILPLFGVALGLLCYYALPYLFGGLVTLGLFMAAGVHFLFIVWVWLVAFVWASAVFFIKMKYRKLGEEIEHYRAAHAALLCGIPYWRKRNELREAFVGEADV